jgi:hypothetical protein
MAITTACHVSSSGVLGSLAIESDRGPLFLALNYQINWNLTLNIASMLRSPVSWVLRQCCFNALRRSNQIADQPLIHLQQAFVLSQIALVVAQVQYPPHLRAQPQCVR